MAEYTSQPGPWKPLESLGLQDIADWGDIHPRQFTARIEPEQKWLYCRVSDGRVSVEVMSTEDGPTEWEDSKFYYHCRDVDREPEIALPLFKRLIDTWRNSRREGSTP